MNTQLLVIQVFTTLMAGLYGWDQRRRRGPTMTPEAARAVYEAARAGAPVTRDEVIRATAVHFASNGYWTEGTVEKVHRPDDYDVRLTDGTLVRAARSTKRWSWRSAAIPLGARVSVLALRGSNRDAWISRLM